MFAGFTSRDLAIGDLAALKVIKSKKFDAIAQVFYLHLFYCLSFPEMQIVKHLMLQEGSSTVPFCLLDSIILLVMIYNVKLTI